MFYQILQPHRVREDYPALLNKSHHVKVQDYLPVKSLDFRVWDRKQPLHAYGWRAGEVEASTELEWTPPSRWAAYYSMYVPDIKIHRSENHHSITTTQVNVYHQRSNHDNNVLLIITSNKPLGVFNKGTWQSVTRLGMLSMDPFEGSNSGNQQIHFALVRYLLDLASFAWNSFLDQIGADVEELVSSDRAKCFSID